MPSMFSLTHPDLVNSAPPETQEASLTTTERGGAKRTAKKTRKRKAPRLSIFDVSKLVVAERIKSRLELSTNERGKGRFSAIHR